MTQSPNNTRTLTPTKSTALVGLMSSVALIFSYIEVLIPFNFGIPGIKLGIANLVIIIALYYLNGKYALIINVVRIVIAGLLFSGVFGMIYSLSGCLLSLFTMITLKRTNLFSVTGVSIAGGVMHNLGQILIAAVVVGNIKVFVYFPVLVISGVISGFIIGFLAYLILKRLPDGTQKE